MCVERNTYDEVRQKAKSLARKLGKGIDDSEDIAQDIVEKKIRSPNRKATIKQLVIDVLRKKYNYKGFGRNYSGENYPKVFSIEYERLEISSEGNLGRDMDFRIDFERILSSLCQKDKEIAKMYFIEGFNEIEIANIYKVSPSRVSQWIKRIQDRIRERAEKLPKSKIKIETELEKILFETWCRLEFETNQSLAFEKPFGLEQDYAPCFVEWIT